MVGTRYGIPLYRTPSCYGRTIDVLVRRVKGFISKNESRRAASPAAMVFGDPLCNFHEQMGCRGSSKLVEFTRRMACINCPLFSSRSGMSYTAFCRRARLSIRACIRELEKWKYRGLGGCFRSDARIVVAIPRSSGRVRARALARASACVRDLSTPVIFTTRTLVA